MKAKILLSLLFLVSTFSLNAQDYTGTTKAGKFASYHPATGDTGTASGVVWNPTTKCFDIVPFSSYFQNIQSVLDVGKTATYDSGNSFLAMLTGSTNNRQTYFVVGNGLTGSSLRRSELSLNNSGYSLNSQYGTKLSDYRSELGVPVTEHSSGAFTTRATYDDPVAVTYLINPALPNDGSYRYLTTGGTTTGFPITGNVEMAETAKGIYFEDTENDLLHRILFGEGGISASYQSGTISRSIGVASDGIQIDGVTSSETVGTSRGLIGMRDFSANITDLDYPQKIYVDDAIDAVTGSVDTSDIIYNDNRNNTNLDMNELDIMNVENVYVNSDIVAGGPIQAANFTGSSSGTNTGDNSVNTNSNAYSDTKVEDAINDGTTSKAPSENAVFDALALKSPINNASMTGTFTLPNGALVITSGSGNNIIRGDGSATNGAAYVQGRVIGTDPAFAGPITSATTFMQAVWFLVPYSATATLDFPSTTTQTAQDLTITVTGASVGKPVNLGVPNASIMTNSNFTAWVSATNTVTVRFNNYSASSKDPASGSFTVEVSK